MPTRMLMATTGFLSAAGGCCSAAPSCLRSGCLRRSAVSSRPAALAQDPAPAAGPRRDRAVRDRRALLPHPVLDGLGGRPADGGDDGRPGERAQPRLRPRASPGVRRDAAGAGLARPLLATKLFPATASQMIRVGEETGSLDAQLEVAAQYFERELDYKIKKVTALIEPAVLLFSGVHRRVRRHRTGLGDVRHLPNGEPGMKALRQRAAQAATPGSRCWSSSSRSMIMGIAVPAVIGSGSRCRRHPRPRTDGRSRHSSCSRPGRRPSPRRTTTTSTTPPAQH